MPDTLAQVPAEIAVLIAALFTALAVLGWSMIHLMHGDRARVRRRLATLAGTAAHAKPAPRRKSVQTRLREAEDSRTRKRGYRLREELMKAGLMISVRRYVAGCGVISGIALAIAHLMAVGVMGSLLTAVLLGVGLPKLVLAVMAGRRVNRFTAQFADAIDIVVRGIRSGLPLGECIAIIGREMPDPLGAEFRLILESQKMGLSLQDAIGRAVERMPTTEMRYFAIVIAIQQQTGGNLADTLIKLSDVLRARKRMRDKVQAFASEARASAYIIGALPLVVILALAGLAPQYIRLLFITETGNLLLFAGGLTEVIGLLVMRKMINFDL